MATFNQLADKESLSKTVHALKERGYTVIVVQNKAEALEKIKAIIPTGSSVMNGTSVTLEQVGYLTYLASGKHGWVDFHARVSAESEPQKRRKLRREASLSDFYLGSVHALSETGEFVVASNTGSQLSHIVSTSPNLIFVVSTKKIVPTVEAALKRVNDYVFPRENKRMMEKYGVGTALNKILVFRGEAKVIGRTITFILVKEDLGF